jgi:hypothetical protein
MLNFSDKQFTSIYALYDKIKTKQNQNNVPQNRHDKNTIG